MKKAIIYYRKSTDRDDKQANSLEHQLWNCRRTANNYKLDVIEEIWESKSAKLEWTRDWFNKLLKLCKTWKIDYIIIDEPKRLSRNNLDSARVIDLFDKKLIKWIYSTWRFYSAEQINDIFLLQLDLSLSKMDNAHRSKEISEKMLTCTTNTKRFLWRAPFWYKNVTLKKWYKDIVIDEKEAKLVKDVFRLRLENKSYKTIARILKEKYSKKIDFDFHANRIQKLWTTKFYYWVFTWAWKEMIWSHIPLVSKEVFEKARIVWKWVHEQEKTLLKNETISNSYYFKWLLKDSFWYKLSGYKKKWIIYYLSQTRSPQQLNINENLIFEQLEKIMKEFDFKNEIMDFVNKNMITNLIENQDNEYWIELLNMDKKIKSLKVKKEKLLDMKLDELIDEKTYLQKHNQLENEIKDCLEQKLKYEKENFWAKTQIMFELSKSLYTSYSKCSNEWKSYIIKKLMFELLIDNKKRLQIAENHLFKSLNCLKVLFGGAKGFDIWTFKENLSSVDLGDLREFYEFIKSWSL